ncbi:MAG: hypothetical protein HN764_14400 [Gammaproteobacteria bacterium]|nr:hypothetical protein [Gammaproteobacteria bacterium]
MKRITKQRQKYKGQAMTEFLISASFFLVPLFLAMSLIGKYIDIKQANIQAARYQAWEYTVWFANDTERGIDYSTGRLNNGGEVMGGFNAFDFPVKSTTKTRDETKQRFYTDPGDEFTTYPITAADSITGWAGSRRNPLWKDHTGAPLYSGANGIRTNLTSSTETPTLPVIGDVINILLKGIGIIFGVVGDLMSLIGSDVGFNAITTEGYANVTESMSISVPPNYRNLTGTDSNLALSGTIPTNFNMIASAAVLSDAWNTGGVEHTYNQVGGMVPTVLLKELINAIPGFSTVWSIASVLAPELRLCNPSFPWPSDDKGSLWLGHIDIDAVHPDRLVADPSDMDTKIGSHELNDAGMSDFTYTDAANARTDASRNCR